MPTMVTRLSDLRTTPTTVEELVLTGAIGLPLDRRTRERGLAHIAEIRRQMAARRGTTPAWMQEAA